MKGRIAGLLALICLLLSGCGTWMDGSYVSVSPHLRQDAQQRPDINWITNADQLYHALVSMVSYGTTSDFFGVQNYTALALARDIEQTEQRIKTTDPIGAYALADITYELGVNGSQSTLAINIEYNHTRQEILRIQKVPGIPSAKTAIEAGLSNMSTDLVLYVTNYRDLDFRQIVENYARDNPHLVMEIPQVTATVYPDSGSDRVVELNFTYQTSRESLRYMQSQVERVFESAELYVSSDETALEMYSHLYVFLMERNDYKLDTSITPSYSLLRNGVGDSKAFAVVFSAMCRRVGLDSMVVSGTRSGEPWFWNIIRNDGVYYHLDLVRCAQDAAFRLQSDDEMTGYVWDYSTVPECDQQWIDPESAPETTAPTETTISVETGSTAEATEPPEFATESED